MACRQCTVQNMKMWSAAERTLEIAQALGQRAVPRRGLWTLRVSRKAKLASSTYKQTSRQAKAPWLGHQSAAKCTCLQVPAQDGRSTTMRHSAVAASAQMRRRAHGSMDWCWPARCMRCLACCAAWRWQQRQGSTGLTTALEIKLCGLRAERFQSARGACSQNARTCSL